MTQLLFLLLATTSQTKTTPTTPPITPILSCHDNILSPTSLSTLLTSASARSHPFTTIHDLTTPPKSHLESVISSILETIPSSASSHAARYVEYWYRSTPQTLPVHRDIDENKCRGTRRPMSLGSDQKMGVQRCPLYGHILYLDANVLSPTLFWEEEDDDDDVVVGEMMTTSKRDSWHSFGAGPPRPSRRLWCVPAKSNRLVRFRGTSLHAVSYPATAFLQRASSSSTSKGGKGGGGDGGTRRAVLLFNTWDEPPSYPPMEEPLAGGGETTKMTGDFILDAGGLGNEMMVRCQGFDEWCAVDIISRVAKEDTIRAASALADRVCFSAPLLGEFSRRGCVEESIDSMVYEDEIIRVLNERDYVGSVTLHPIPRI